HLARVELAEIDRLGGVAVRFRPGLRLLENHHGGELVLAPAEDAGNSDEELHALGRRRTAPLRKGLVRGFDGAHGVFAGSLREAADDLRLLRRVDRLEMLGGADFLASDVVLSLKRKPRFDFPYGFGESAAVCLDAEVGRRLVLELGKQKRHLRAEIYNRRAGRSRSGAFDRFGA